MSRYLKKDDRNYGELLLENIELRRRIMKLEEALLEYADKDSWGFGGIFDKGSYICGWEIAEKVLQK